MGAYNQGVLDTQRVAIQAAKQAQAQAQLHHLSYSSTFGSPPPLRGMDTTHMTASPSPRSRSRSPSLYTHLSPSASSLSPYLSPAVAPLPPPPPVVAPSSRLEEIRRERMELERAHVLRMESYRHELRDLVSERSQV